MPTEPHVPTLREVVQRAIDAVEVLSDAEDPDLAELQLRFEDADTPVTAIEDFGLHMAEAIGTLDPQEESGSLQLAGAVATYLRYRRDEFDEGHEELVRLAVRAEMHGKPPANVQNLLDLGGVSL